MKPGITRPDDRGRGEPPDTDASAWEARLLALNALVELARHHGVAATPPGHESYRLERAIAAVRQAIAGDGSADRANVDAAATALGEAMAGLDAGIGQRP